LEKPVIKGPRERQTLAALPDLGQMVGCLYVGANARRFQLHALMPRPLIVLEVFPRYVEQLRGSSRWRTDEVICGDIRDFEGSPGMVDLLCWWHGPEHVGREQAARLLGPASPLHRIYRRAFLVGAPWGHYRQGVVDGNPAQEHLSHLEPDFFESLGYHTATLGACGVRGGHITAWLRASNGSSRGCGGLGRPARSTAQPAAQT